MTKPLDDVSGDAAGLPLFVSIPYAEYAAADHPVLRLHRLCDTAELVTRFTCTVLLADLRVRSGGILPDDLRRDYGVRLETPTFGVWCHLLVNLEKRLRSESALVAPELVGFAARDLLPLLRESGDPMISLVALRNSLVHGGVLGEAMAERFLGYWHPHLVALVRTLSTLGLSHVCQVLDARPHPLTADGVSPDPLPASADLRHGLGPLGGRIVLLRPEAGRWLDLWPVCEFDVARMESSDRMPWVGRGPVPWVYYRLEKRRLRYAALGGDVPFGERGDEAVREFRRLFGPTSGSPGGPAEEVRTRADAFVGREPERKALLAAVRDGDGQFIWVGGTAGVGKSFLAARLAADVHTLDAHRCFYWRFSADDPDTLSRECFRRSVWTWLAGPLGRAAKHPPCAPDDLRRLLGDYLGAASPDRPVFVLDGLDELAGRDPDFPRELRRELAAPGVVCVGFGRPHPALAGLEGCCRPAFPGGVPLMTDGDIRALLLEETGGMKYGLLEREGDGRGTNAVVAAVVRRVGGLPQYVRMLVEDVTTGRFRFDDLERHLPASLNDYYAVWAERLGTDDVRSVVPRLVALAATAPAPPDEETLFWVLAAGGAVDEAGRDVFAAAIQAADSLLQVTPEGVRFRDTGFREFVRSGASGRLVMAARLARRDWAAAARDWAGVPAGHPVRGYLLRHAPRALHATGDAAGAARLALDPVFLEARAGAGLVADVSDDLAAASALPAAPERDLALLLRQAVEQDRAFLDRHPELLFQVAWNRGWWFDAPDTAGHFARPPAGGVGLHPLLERWRKLAPAAAVWVRSLRPPEVPLISGRITLSEATEVVCAAVGADPARAVTIDRTGHLSLWDARTGQRIVRHLSPFPAVWAGVLPDGQRVALLAEDGRLILWNTATAAADRTFDEPDMVYRTAVLSPDGRRLAAGGMTGRSDAPDNETVCVWNLDNRTDALTIHTKLPITLLEFSPSGQKLAVVLGGIEGIEPNVLRILSRGGVAGSTIQLWDVGDVPTKEWSRTWPVTANELQGVVEGKRRIKIHLPSNGARQTIAIRFLDEGRILTEHVGPDGANGWDVATGAPFPLGSGEVYHPHLRHMFRDDSEFVKTWPSPGALLATSADYRWYVIRTARERVDIWSGSADGPDQGAVRVGSGETGEPSAISPRHIIQEIGLPEPGRGPIAWRVWDWATGCPAGGLIEAEGGLSVLAVSPDGDRAAVACGASVVVAGAGERIRHPVAARTAALAADATLVAACDDGLILLCRPGARPVPLTAGGPPVTGLALDPGCERLAVARGDRVEILTLAQPSAVVRTEAPAEQVTWAPDGSRLLAWDRSVLAVLTAAPRVLALHPLDLVGRWQPGGWRGYADDGVKRSAFPFAFTSGGRTASVLAGDGVRTVLLETGEVAPASAPFPVPRVPWTPAETVVCAGEPHCPLAVIPGPHRDAMVMGDGVTLVLRHTNEGRLEIIRLEGWVKGSGPATPELAPKLPTPSAR